MGGGGLLMDLPLLVGTAMDSKLLAFGFMHPVPANPADVPGLVRSLSGLGLLPGFSADRPGRSRPQPELCPCRPPLAGLSLTGLPARLGSNSLLHDTNFQPSRSSPGASGLSSIQSARTPSPAPPGFADVPSLIPFWPISALGGFSLPGLPWASPALVIPSRPLISTSCSPAPEVGYPLLCGHPRPHPILAVLCLSCLGLLPGFSEDDPHHSRPRPTPRSRESSVPALCLCRPPAPYFPIGRPTP